MKTADAIIKSLRDNGVKRVYGVIGGANSDLIDAFTRIKGIEFIAVMHEQAASFMAEVEAKLDGFACVIVTSGPGGQNLLTGIANCYYDSTPVLFITGQVNSQFMGNGKVRQVGFQENDIVSQVKNVTKMAVLVKDRVLYQLQLAVKIAKDGRPGPVLLDIPVDVQKAEL
jgi:acetolactate synthase-1/2/3 large subunit